MSQAVARDPIQDFVQSAAVHIRKTELFYGWMVLLSVQLFSIFLFVLVDHWLWEFNKPVRFLLWIGLAAWSLWWFLRRILPPIRFRIHPEYAARQFELQDPRSKDSLISWIQLNQTANNAPKSVLNFVGRYAFGFLRNSDASQVADTASLIRLSAAFFGCLLCTLIYFLASPKSGLTSTARMLMPWANIAPATRVQFAQITPGTTTIMQGSFLPIDVTVRGLLKSEKVFLRYDLSDGQVRGQNVPMKEEIQGINYKIDFGKDSGGLHQPLTYWIHAGDAVAGPFDVHIQIVPLVAIDHIDLDFPAYTKLKPRSIQQQGHFEAPEGTVARIHAVANQEMQNARIEFDPVLQNKLFISAREFLDMRVDKTQLVADWTATIDRKNSIEKRITNYRIHAFNSLKESNHDPIIYQIKIIPDLPPEIEFASNSNLPVELPLDQALSIDLNARDPDYGLSSVEIRGEIENKLSPQEPKVIFREVLFETPSEDESPRSKNTSYTFVPQNHQLKAGDQIDLVGIAKDNFHNPTSRKLDPQQALSQLLRIRIVEPESKVENSQDTIAPSEPNAPKIAEVPPPTPKQRIDWDKFRTNPKNDGARTNPSNKQQDSSEKNPSETNQSQTPRGGLSGGSDGGEQKTGSKQDDANAQSNPSNATPSDQSNPNDSQMNGSVASSNNLDSENDSQRNPGKTRNQSSNQTPNQDRDAFEKIQEFIREQKQNPSEAKQSNRSINNSDAPVDGDSEMNDKAGTDKAGNDKAGSDKAGSDKAGNDKAGNDKAGNDKAGSDKAGSDKAGSDKAGSDKAGTDKAGTDKAGTDKAGTDKAGTDKAGTDKAGSDKAGSDKAGSDKAGSDKAGSDKAGSDKAGSDKAGSDKAGSDKAGSDKAGSDKAGNDKAGNDKAGNDKAGNDKAGNDKAGNDKAGNDKAGNDKAGNDKAGNDKAGTDKAGTDKAGTDKAGTDKAGTDKAGTDKAGTDKAGTDKAGTDKAGTDKAGTDKAGSDKAGSDKAGNDKAGSDKAGSDKAGSDKAGSDKAGSDKAGSDKAGSDKAGSDKAGSDKAGNDKAGNDKAGNDKAGNDKAGNDKAGSDKAGSSDSGMNKTTAEKQSASDQQEQKNSSVESNSKSNQNPQKGPDAKNASDQENKQQGDGKGSGDQKGGKQGEPKASQPSSAGSGVNNTGMTPQSSGSGGSGPSQSAEFGAEQAKEEYSRKAGEMLLDYIDRQRDQPDPELLKRLNWNSEDFRRFADRWREAKEQAKLDPNKQAELDETLKNLGLSGTGQKVNKLKDRNDGLRGMQEQGGRLRPPEALREQFEAFRKAAGKLGK